VAALIYCRRQKDAVPSPVCSEPGAARHAAASCGCCAGSRGTLPGVGQASWPALQRQEKAGRVDLVVLTEVQRDPLLITKEVNSET